MKKLISISLALALLVTFTVPVVVAADTDWAGEPGPIENPGAYSKTPFGIFGSAIQLMGFLLNDLTPVIEGAGVDLPIDMADLQVPALRTGAWIAGPLAWMTDMTAWFMITIGDVIATAGGLVEGMGVELPFDLADISDIFYVVSARLFDEWGIYPAAAPGEHGRP